MVSVIFTIRYLDYQHFTKMTPFLIFVKKKLRFFCLSANVCDNDFMKIFIEILKKEQNKYCIILFFS